MQDGFGVLDFSCLSRSSDRLFPSSISANDHASPLISGGQLSANVTFYTRGICSSAEIYAKHTIQEFGSAVPKRWCPTSL